MNRGNCKFYSETTQYHFLNCPHFSHKVSEQIKKALKSQQTDSVVFNVNDFDSVNQTSIQDLIEEVRQQERLVTSRQLSDEVQNVVERLVCVSCGEPISDVEFITVQDGKGTVIYFHSRCKKILSLFYLKIKSNRWIKHEFFEIRFNSDEVEGVWDDNRAIHPSHKE